MKDIKKPCGIIFDFGGTILHEDTFDPLAGSARLLEFVKDAHGHSAESVQSLALEISRDHTREEAIIEFSCQAFHRLLFESLGMSLSISYAEAEKEFWRASTSYVPTEGICDVLNLLDTKRIKAGILSNSGFAGVILEDELEKHSLAHRFSFVISSADYVFRKPHPRIFQVAVKKMNLPPEDIWFVGDKLEFDVKGACASGLFAVWYNPAGLPRTGDYDCLEVRSWKEFGEIIERLGE